MHTSLNLEKKRIHPIPPLWYDPSSWKIFTPQIIESFKFKKLKNLLKISKTFQRERMFPNPWTLSIANCGITEIGRIIEYYSRLVCLRNFRGDAAEARQNHPQKFSEDL